MQTMQTRVYRIIPTRRIWVKADRQDYAKGEGQSYVRLENFGTYDVLLVMMVQSGRMKNLGVAAINFLGLFFLCLADDEDLFHT